MRPPDLDDPELWTWLDAHRGTRMRLPVAIEVAPLQVRATFAGKALRLDSTALSMTLRDHVHRCGERCELWLEGSWGPLLGVEAFQEPTFAVRAVGEPVTGKRFVDLLE